MPVFLEVPLGTRLLAAETGTHVEDALESVCGSLQIEAGALRQKHGLALDVDAHGSRIVVQRRGRQDRGVELHEALRFEPFAHNLHQLRAVAKHGHNLRIPKVDGTISHHVSRESFVEDVELGARLGVEPQRSRTEHDDLVEYDLTLISIGTEPTGDADTGLERRAEYDLEHLGAEILTMGHHLNGARRIDHVEEHGGSVDASRLQPPEDLNLGVDMGLLSGELRDVDGLHCAPKVSRLDGYVAMLCSIVEELSEPGLLSDITNTIILA